jgi:gamma-glutamylcyclotransferase (GGCT)/AIG2-like uncharacterized protein YtfP
MKNNNNEKKEECNRLFVYGTLQHNQSRGFVLQGLKFQPAILPHYRKVIPPDLGFPFIVQEENSSVQGEIYYDLDEDIWKKIDLIEGEGNLYRRILVKVKPQNGEDLTAYTYYPLKILIDSYL